MSLGLAMACLGVRSRNMPQPLPWVDICAELSR
jgi:hypothetical protein